MNDKSKFKIGETIIIKGDSANNPKTDIGMKATIKEIRYQFPQEKNAIYYDPIIKRPVPGTIEHRYFFAFEKDCRKEPSKNNIISRKIAEGDTATLLEMELIDKDNNMTTKGYEFIKKFE